MYNHLLVERRDAWEQRQESVRLYDQQATLPVLKADRPALAGVQSQVLQNVAVRIDLAFQAFFRRVRAGETSGYPRFRGQGCYDSITFPQVPVGCKLDSDAKRLRIANVGMVKIALHRLLEGAPKTATLSRSSTGKWYVCFSCECAEPSPLPETGEMVGIDVGLKTFATLSNGQEIANPHFFRVEEKALATTQRRLSKEEKGTPERASRCNVVARVYERIAWRRGDFAHQHSRRILTLRRGESPTGSRFSDAGSPTPPRRRGPRLAMFLAALWSRCRRVAQSGPSWQRTDTPCWTIAPRPAHVWLVNAGSPACPVLPAFAAVTIRMARKADPPASAMDLARW